MYGIGGLTAAHASGNEHLKLEQPTKSCRIITIDIINSDDVTDNDQTMLELGPARISVDIHHRFPTSGSRSRAPMLMIL